MPRKKKRNSPRIFFLFLILVIIISFLLYRLSKFSMTTLDKEPQTEIDISSFNEREQINYFADFYGILRTLVRVTTRGEVQEITLPVDFNTVDLYLTNHRLTQFLTDLNWKFITGTESAEQNLQVLTFVSPGEITYRFRLIYASTTAYPAVKPKLSIIIKGFGSLGHDDLERWLGLDKRICFSVLPINRTSRMNMQSILNNEFEGLIEIPMEDAGHPFIPTPDYAIFAHYTDKQVVRKLNSYFSMLHGATGVITHRGGLITTDRRLIPLILGYIKAKDMYFVDDRAIETSIAFIEAQRMMLTSYEKSLTLVPSNYINNDRKLRADIQEIQKSPVIITLQKPDNETYELVLRLIRVVQQDLGFELVRVSDLRNI